MKRLKDEYCVEYCQREQLRQKKYVSCCHNFKQIKRLNPAKLLELNYKFSSLSLETSLTSTVNVNLGHERTAKTR